MTSPAPHHLPGVTLVAGALNSTTFSLQGTVADINSTLASSVTFSPTGNFNGNANLTVEVDDLGNSGGPAESTTAPVTAAASAVGRSGPRLGYPVHPWSSGDDTLLELRHRQRARPQVLP